MRNGTSVCNLTFLFTKCGWVAVGVFLVQCTLPEENNLVLNITVAL